MKRHSLKHYIYTTLTVALLTLGLYTFATVDHDDEIRFTSIHSATAIDIVNKLKEHHYSHQPIDEELSSEHLDNYIQRLDNNRTLFLQSDIDEFEQYRKNLTGRLSKGDLTPGLMIFNRYQQRLTDRLQYLADNIPAMIAKMDFTVDEEIDLDRSEYPWPANQAETDDLWRKIIQNQVINLRLADKPEDEIAPLLVKRYQHQLNRAHQSNAEDAFQLYINALTELYDPHTNYLSPSNSENFAINMSLTLEGIGAILQSEHEYTKVVRLVHAGPADKQGELQPADRITAVAQGEKPFQDVVGLRLDEVVELIRGPKGSVVRLEVIPVTAKSEEERRIIEITRNEVMLEEQSAQKEIIEVVDGNRTVKVGVIDIPAFYMDFEAMNRGDKAFKSTTRDVAALLNELLQEGVEGIVIDLRNNGGGSLQEANALTGLFIDSGATVQIRDADNKVFRDGKRQRSAFYDGPLVVLINRLSASASEIFAGAIQDYQRGLVVGAQSFGKGSVQSLTPLKQGQLKMTESKFYRISGESTQHRGIMPDIVFPALYDTDRIGESTLDNALPWDAIMPIRHPLYFDLPTALPELEARHRQRIKADPDFIFLQEQIAQLDKTRDITTLSLNEKVRRTQWEQDKKDTLMIENKRRQAKGLPLLASLDDDLDGNEDTLYDQMLEELESPELDDGADNIEDNDQEEAIDDPLLIEAAHILADSIHAYPHRQYVVH